MDKRRKPMEIPRDRTFCMGGWPENTEITIRPVATRPDVRTIVFRNESDEEWLYLTESQIAQLKSALESYELKRRWTTLNGDWFVLLQTELPVVTRLKHVRGRNVGAFSTPDNSLVFSGLDQAVRLADKNTINASDALLIQKEIQEREDIMRLDNSDVSSWAEVRHEIATGIAEDLTSVGFRQFIARVFRIAGLGGESVA